MKSLVTMTAAGILAFSLAGAASATEFTKGTVKKIDLKAGKVTIMHEELINLDMPAMTMVFRTADDEMLESMEEGQAIEFVAERVNGKLTVVELK